MSIHGNKKSVFFFFFLQAMRYFLIFVLALASIASASLLPATYSKECLLCEHVVPTIVKIFSNATATAEITKSLRRECEGMGKDEEICDKIVEYGVGALVVVADLAVAGKVNATKVICKDWLKYCPSDAATNAKLLPVTYPTMNCKECKQLVELLAPIFYYNMSWIKELIKIGCEKAAQPPNECEVPLIRIAESIHYLETLTWSKHDLYLDWVCHESAHICPASLVGNMKDKGKL